MKNLFQLIDQIKTSSTHYDLRPDDAFNAFVIQRGLSMISPSVCDLVNSLSNKYIGKQDDQVLMDLWTLLVPKSSSYNKWIKKDEKVVNKNNRDKLKEYAIRWEKPLKVIEDAIDLDPNFLSNYEEKHSIRKKAT